MLGGWPSINPQNFSQFKPSDPSNTSWFLFTVNVRLHIGSLNKTNLLIPKLGMKMTPVTYRPTHDRTIPPPDQVITSDAKNILLRHFYQRAEEKLRPKRAASENLSPEHANKHPRASASDSSL